MDFRNKDNIFIIVLFFWSLMIIPSIVYDWNPLIHNLGFITTLAVLVIVDKYTNFIRN